MAGLGRLGRDVAMIEVITKRRRGGKTTALIRRADYYHGHIVCESMIAAYRIMDMAKYMGCNINHPITYYKFVSGKYRSEGVKELLIDNVDMLIEYMSNVPVVAVTMNEEVRTDKPTMGQLEEWMHDGVCEATDGCRVEMDGTCPHGCKSWFLELGMI